MIRLVWVRARVLLALTACASFQLAGAVHTATVRHVRCADHGALVELGASAGVAHGPRPEACVHPGDEADAHHAHCELSSTTPSRLGHPRPSVRPAARSIVVTTTAPTAAHAAIALLALAPKSSPPV